MLARTNSVGCMSKRCRSRQGNKYQMTDLERIEHKIDLIISSLGLDGSHTRLEMERKAPAVVDIMLKRQLKKSRKEFIKEE